MDRLSQARGLESFVWSLTNYKYEVWTSGPHCLGSKCSWPSCPRTLCIRPLLRNPEGEKSRSVVSCLQSSRVTTSEQQKQQQQWPRDAANNGLIILTPLHRSSVRVGPDSPLMWEHSDKLHYKVGSILLHELHEFGWVAQVVKEMIFFCKSWWRR